MSNTGFHRARPADLPTPFVEIDELRLERNMGAMQQRADKAGVLLFPHIKTHKSVVLAERQLALGATGITSSKPAEALVFVERGIPSVILAYPIVRAEALDRLLKSVKGRGTRLSTIACNAIHVVALSTAASRHQVEIGVFIKVDVGLGRIGVNPSDPAVISLVSDIHQAEYLRFDGLLSHAGHSYGAKDGEERTAIAQREAQTLLDLAEILKAQGFDVPRISVGATPTCLGAELPAGITDIRPGNYVFLDGTALRLGICTPDDIALSVVATVVSSNDTHFIIDAGSKSLSSDLGAHGTGGKGFGTVLQADHDDTASWLVEKLSEEHGFVRHEENAPPVGSRVRIFPNHACAVMAQFDEVTVRKTDGRPAQIRVDARGCQISG